MLISSSYTFLLKQVGLMCIRVFIPALLFAKLGLAQNRAIQVNIGRSFNGTGDIRGFGFSVEYSKNLKKKFDWTATIGSIYTMVVFQYFLTTRQVIRLTDQCVTQQQVFRQLI